MTFTDNYKPNCQIKMENWAGSDSFEYRTGYNPKKVIDKTLFFKVGPKKWMSVSKKTGEKRFYDQENDNTLKNDNFTG